MLLAQWGDSLLLCGRVSGMWASCCAPHMGEDRSVCSWEGHAGGAMTEPARQTLRPSRATSFLGHSRGINDEGSFRSIKKNS